MESGSTFQPTRRQFIKGFAALGTATAITSLLPREALALSSNNVNLEPTEADLQMMEKRTAELLPAEIVQSKIGAPTWMGRGAWAGNFANRTYAYENFDPNLLDSYMRSHSYCAISPLIVPAIKNGMDQIYWDTVGNKQTQELNKTDALNLYWAYARNKKLSNLATSLIGLEVIFEGWGVTRAMINADVLALRHAAIHEGYIPKDLINPQLPKNEQPSTNFVADLDPYEFSSMKKNAIAYNANHPDAQIDINNVGIHIPLTEKWDQIASLTF